MHPHVRSLLRTCAAVVAPVAVGLGIAATAPAFAAATTAGTTISNTATATYSDGTNTYNSQSNTVTTTVQNAPSLTISPTSASPGGSSVSPSQTVTSDVYTLTNTGNGAGYFQLSGVQSTDDGVTAGSGTFVQYVVNAGSGAQNFTTIAAANTYLSTGNSGGPFLTAVNGTITVGVTYSVNVGATGTVTTKVTPDIVMPAGSGTTQQTSSTVVGQYNDTVTPDARVDAQKTASVGGTVAVPTVTYTVRFANGGSRAIQPVFKNALPGGNAGTYSGCTNSTACGVVFTDHIPSYNATQLTLSGTPSISGASGTVIYSTDGTTWTTTATGATYVGVFVPATSLTGADLAHFIANSNASSSNSVTAGQASLTLTYTINGSTASGGANATAITNVVNSIFADQAGFIEGPGITVATVSNGSAATTSNTAPAIANTNGALPGSATVTSAASPSANSVLNGPNGFPGAIGADATTNTDYTALSYTNGATILSAVNGASVSVPASAAAITFTNSVQNTGNINDTYNLTAATGTGLTALPAGWTVIFQTVTQAASGSCPSVTGGSTITTIAVPSGCTMKYAVVYTPPASATSFSSYTAYGDAVTATSQNDNTKTNVTLDQIFVGGYVKLSKTLSVALGQPCATATTWTLGSASVNPGDCIQYAIAYANVAPSGGTNNATLNASSFVISEDGTASGGTTVAYANTWATNSNGLYAAPTDTNGGTLGGYTSAGVPVGSLKFTDTVGALIAGGTGTCTFKVQVK